MPKMEEIMKRAVVAGASHALRYKERNPSASESEAMKHVMADMRTIIEDIDAS